jgi:hypothetical protein
VTDGEIHAKGGKTRYCRRSGCHVRMERVAGAERSMVEKSQSGEQMARQQADWMSSMSSPSGLDASPPYGGVMSGSRCERTSSCAPDSVSWRTRRIPSTSSSRSDPHSAPRSHPLQRSSAAASGEPAPTRAAGRPLARARRGCSRCRCRRRIRKGAIAGWGRMGRARMRGCVGTRCRRRP